MFPIQMIVAPLIGLVAEGWAFVILAWTPPRMVFPTIWWPIITAGVGSAVLTMLEPRSWFKVATTMAVPSVLVFGLVARGPLLFKLSIILITVGICGYPAVCRSQVPRGEMKKSKRSYLPLVAGVFTPAIVVGIFQAWFGTPFFHKPFIDPKLLLFCTAFGMIPFIAGKPEPKKNFLDHRYGLNY